jgi:hypothetical protein
MMATAAVVVPAQAGTHRAKCTGLWNNLDGETA